MLQTSEILKISQHESEKINPIESLLIKNNSKTTSKEFIKKHNLPTNTNIAAIRAFLYKLNTKINTIVNCEGTNKQYIETKSIQIDWVIYQLALKTPSYPKRERRENARLKELAWTLLEKLEAYCSTKLGISIW